LSGLRNEVFGPIFSSYVLDVVAMAQLILTTPNGRTSLRAVLTPATTIGRGPMNHLMLDSPLVSRRHATLETNGPFCTVHDLGSKNGTYVNGSLVKSQVLANGDTIGIGDCLLKFTSTEQEAVSDEAIKRISERGMLY